MRLPVMPPVDPMLARSVPAIPESQLYEPKWDGFRAIVFRDGDEVEIGSRNTRPMARYFPEICEAIRRNTPPRCVLDGEIVVPDGDGRRLDFFALQQRLHPAKSRVDLLAAETPATFIAFDLLALGDDSLMDTPFEQRRARLEDVVGVRVTPMTRDRETAQQWFEQFEGAGLDGVIAKRPEATYQPGKRVMSKIKHVRTADVVLAGFRPHVKEPEAVGSLLLGLYMDDAQPTPAVGAREHFDGLAPVGVVGAFPMARRRQLFQELQPLVIPFEEHPWGGFTRELAETNPERAGLGSRWNPGKSLSFVPLRIERVLEVRYDHLEGARFRHPPQFVRWRPDREPASCGYAQLDRPVEYDLAAILDR